MKIDRILFVTYELPFTKDTGDKIYTVNVLEGLVNIGYRVDVLAYGPSLGVEIDKEKLSLAGVHCYIVEFVSRSKFRIILSKDPGMVANRKRKAYLSKFESLVSTNNYSHIFINHLKMCFVLPFCLKRKTNEKLVYIAHNAEYLLSKNNSRNTKSAIMRFIYWQDSIKTRRYESKWLGYFDSISSISEYDYEYFIGLNTNQRVRILRPVIDFNRDIDCRKKNSRNIVIVGSFNWPPKIENLLSFLNAPNFSLLATNRIKLTIVGNADSEFVVKINNSYPGVHMTGRVESVDRYYKNASIAVIPETLGGGFKLKVAEAALNKSAIFALQGAITDCNFKKNYHFVEAVNPEELINKIVEYQDRQVELENMISAAHTLASNDFNRESLTKGILDLLENL